MLYSTEPFVEKCQDSRLSCGFHELVAEALGLSSYSTSQAHKLLDFQKIKFFCLSYYLDSVP